MKPYVIKNGVILGLTFIIFKYIGFMAGLNTPTYYVLYMGTVVALPIILVYGIKRYREEVNAGLISFKEAFGLGLLIIILGQGIGTLGDFIYMQFIDPEFVEKAIALQIEGMEDWGMTEEQIAEALPRIEKFSKPYISAPINFFQKVVGNSLLLLIIAAVLKRNPSFE